MRGKERLQALFRFPFKDDPNAATKMKNVFLGFLFLSGALFWISYLQLETNFYTNEDWPHVFKSLSVWKDALTHGTIPYYISKSIPTHQTKLFFAVPEFPFTPQLFLLLFLGPKAYVLANTLLLYALGFIGSLKIRKHFRLSAFTFTAFFLLFNFNGHFISRLSVGHYTWIGYFLLPFYILLVLQIFDNRGSKKSPYWLALVLFAILLQGSVHVFIFCLIFLGLVLLFSRASAFNFTIAIIFSLLLSAFRLFPASLVFFQRNALIGYQTPVHLLNSIIYINTEQFISPNNSGVGYWEYNLFIGLLGLLFTLLFGLIPYIFNKTDTDVKKYRQLIIPIGIMILLSFGNIYTEIVSQIPVDVLRAARVPSRFMIIPLLFLILLACIQADCTLRKAKISYLRGIVLSLFFVAGAFSLGLNGMLWKLSNMQLRAGPPEADWFQIPDIVSGSNPQYLQMLAISGLISLVAFSFVLFMLRNKWVGKEKGVVS